MRLIRVTGADLSLFEFDYDVTWAAFFLNTNGKIYGRFGGRDAKGPDTRNSLEGLRFAMTAALEEHRKNPTAGPDRPLEKPVYVEKLPTAKQYRGCIHCHQVNEILIAEKKNAGSWLRESIYSYPLPENIGITLDRAQGNRVSEVLPNSLAAKVGIQPGDVVRTINKLPIHSFADASYALHKAPLVGSIPIAWQHDGKDRDATLVLAAGWRRTNITWRPSLMDHLPTMYVFGTDLTIQEKKALGLDEKRLAFRQEAPIHPNAHKIGVRENDIILGIDNKNLEMSMQQFLGYVRQNYLIDETITINLLRDGKRVDIPFKLK